MEENGLHPADVAVLIGYLLGITALGVWMSRRVTSASDYFMPRRFGKAVMLMHAFGTGTASDQAVTVASKTFTNGLSGIWFQWQWLFSTPFYWLLAPIMRRFRAVTTADVTRLRFDDSVAVLFAIVGILGNAIKIGLLLKGSAALIDSGTGQLVDANLAIAAMTVLFVVYGAAGGLAAAIVTDFIQGILTIVFSFMLLPFVWNAVGGMAGVRETVTDEAMLSLVAPGEIGVFYIVMFSLQTLVGIIAQPHVMGVCGAGRTEMDGRVGFMFGNLVKRICTIAWCLTGIAALAWYIQNGEDPSAIPGDNVYGNMAREFLPRIAPGLLGIFLASLLAGVMSSCDSIMISASGLFTENIYRRWISNRTASHYLWVARVTGLLVVLGGMAFAYWVPSVVAALKIWLSIAPMMGMSLWISFFWRRLTPMGAWAGTLIGFLTWYLATLPSIVAWLASSSLGQSLGIIWGEGEAARVYEPWRITAYLLTGCIAAVAVSYLTPSANKERLDRFYTLMRTPVEPGEVIDEPCTLPAGVEPVPRRLVRLGDVEIPVPSQASVIGFVAGCIAVGLLIGSFFWIVNS